MNSTQSTQTNVTTPSTTSQPTQMTKLQLPEEKPLTFGQKLADKMAAKVGSWGFLIGQSTVLVGWVSCNLIPGLPHWDESPFILLNLMFSFASAYTAPVVLMSQNRQSEEDRENAKHNYQVMLQAAEKLELLHEKLDSDYAVKLDNLSAQMKQQAGEAKVVFMPAQVIHELKHEPHQVATVSFLNTHPGEAAFVTVDKNCGNVEVKIDR